MAIEKPYWWGQTYLFHLSFQCLSAIEPAIMRIQCTVVARNTGAWKSRTDFSYKEDAYKHSHHYHLNSAMSVCSSHCSLKPLVQFFTGKECSVIKVLKLYPYRFKKSYLYSVQHYMISSAGVRQCTEQIKAVKYGLQRRGRRCSCSTYTNFAHPGN